MGSERVTNEQAQRFAYSLFDKYVASEVQDLAADLLDARNQRDDLAKVYEVVRAERDALKAGPKPGMTEEVLAKEIDRAWSEWEQSHNTDRVGGYASIAARAIIDAAIKPTEGEARCPTCGSSCHLVACRPPGHWCGCPQCDPNYNLASLAASREGK